jgi:uroporphyrinogen-III synthase
VKVLVLRPEDSDQEFARVLSAMGAEAVIVPAIRLVERRRWRVPTKRFDWLVFTSTKGVSVFAERVDRESRRLSDRVWRSKVAAIGPKTGEALSRLGIEVAWIPAEYTTEALALGLPAPGRVLLVRGSYADNELEKVLVRRGFRVERLDVYSTEHIGSNEIRKALADGVDVIAFTSASIVDSFAASGAPLTSEIVCSIGPATSRACARLGLPVHVEATEQTGAGLARAITKEMVRV